MAESKKKAEPLETQDAQSGKAKKENDIEKAVSTIPFKSVQDWFLMYFFPEDTYNKVTEKATLMQAAKTLATAGLVTGIAYGIYLVIVFVLASTLFGSVLGGLSGGMVGGAVGLIAALIMAFIMVVLTPIAMVAGGFISSGIYFVLAKALGGKGAFTQQTVGIAYFQAGTTILSIPFLFFGMIPCAGMIFSLIALVIWAYGCYSFYRIIKAAHQLSNAKAILVTMVPPVIILALVGIAYAFMIILPILTGIR